VQEDKDWVMLADLYDTQLMDFLLSVQEKIILTEEFVLDEDRARASMDAISKKDWGLGEVLKNSTGPLALLDQGYLVEYTAGGDFTLGIQTSERLQYFHSNNRVWEEAALLAKSWYKEDKDAYIVYGLGFGYHIMELYKCDADVSVEVYESDINIIKLACTFTDFSNLVNKPNFKLYYDPRFVRFKNRMKRMEERTDFVIHHPSIANVRILEMKQKLEDYFIQYSSIKNQAARLNGNFNVNTSVEHPLVDELEEVFQNKDLYIIAAGPSLDKNFMKLKDVSKKGIILATGTVFRKLMDAGIRPDYVIVTDAMPRVYRQIKGLTDSGVPLVFLSTANRRIVKEYEAKKYIVFQKDYDLAEEAARKNGCRLYNTGGSVSTTALDIGIQLNCNRIVFLGLDLSYPNHLAHAEGTSLRELKDTSGLRQVKDASGEMVYTNKAMDIYRKWIEDRIKGMNKPKIIDATEGGALIQGMERMKLRDVIR
jgi:hypothetical protein